jgi:hypothetical protein
MSRYGNRPMGLLARSVGGTIIEMWSPPEVMTACGLPNVSAGSPATCSKQYNSNLYEQLIKPLVPTNISAAFWYQGVCTRATHTHTHTQAHAQAMLFRTHWMYRVLPRGVAIGNPVCTFAFFHAHHSPINLPDFLFIAYAVAQASPTRVVMRPRATQPGTTPASFPG